MPGVKGLLLFRVLRLDGQGMLLLLVAVPVFHQGDVLPQK